MWWVITFAFPAEKVLSDEVKRKQYDLGFDPNRGSTGKQQHYRAGATSIDPEELFRRIFGEFADFGHFDSFFDDRPEVWHVFKCQFELFPWAQSSASLLWTAFSFWWSSRFWRQWWVPIKTWVWTSRTPAWGVTEVAASRAPRCLCATTVTALAWWVFCPLCCRKSWNRYPGMADLSAAPPAGVHQHRFIYDAQHLSTLRWQEVDHKHALRAVSRLRPDEEETDHHCSSTCWWECPHFFQIQV